MTRADEGEGREPGEADYLRETIKLVEWQRDNARQERTEERFRAAQAEAEVARLRERVATLEAALQPFAEASENLDDGQSGHLWESPAAMALDAEHLRAARTALEAPHADN